MRQASSSLTIRIRAANFVGLHAKYPRRNAQKCNLFPKWESFKNKSRKSGVFFKPKNDRQLTSFHQQSTTNSPSKNHVLHPVFAKTPSKNVGYPRQKKFTAKMTNKKNQEEAKRVSCWALRSSWMPFSA